MDISVEIVNASAEPADPAFVGTQWLQAQRPWTARKKLKNEVPGASKKLLNEAREAPKSLSGVAPGPLPGALGALRRQKCVETDFGVPPGLSRTALDASWVAFGVPGGAPGMVL